MVVAEARRRSGSAVVRERQEPGESVESVRLVGVIFGAVSC